MMTHSGKLEGKVVIVAGAVPDVSKNGAVTENIGSATVRRIVEEGGKVLFTDLPNREETATTMVEELGADNVEFFPADLTDDEQVDLLFKKAMSRFGRIDGVFANAGVGKDEDPAHDDVAEMMAFHDFLMKVNERLPYIMALKAREYYDIMEAEGKNPNMSVVITSSIWGLQSPQAKTTPLAYGTSKHANVGTMRNLSKTYARNGLRIRVNTVHPGYVTSPMVPYDEPGNPVYDALAAWHAMGRLGKPEEIASEVVHLLSDETSFVTGSMRVVDGGLLG